MFRAAVASSMFAVALAAGYGPLSPKKDMSTGLELLALPEGFTYMSYGWTGQWMSDGEPTPTDHDGMAVVDRIGDIIAIVRNHETSLGEGAQIFTAGTYNARQYGGTTNLYFDIKEGKWVGSDSSLGGTIRPCAGGPTPWGSWLAAEETRTYDEEAQLSHGFLFDVLGFRGSDGVPIRKAGRFSHEAAAVDPGTGYVYETEDARPAGFYRYISPEAEGENWKEFYTSGQTLQDGGKLYVLKIVDMPGKNLYGWSDSEGVEGVGEIELIEVGTSFDVEWVEIPNPDPDGPLSSTSAGAEAENSAILFQVEGAALFTRLEGAWQYDGRIYFVATDGGAVKEGQIWEYNPGNEKLTLIYQSPDASVMDAPDNIAVSPNGAYMLCEDGGSDPKRLIGLSQEGETFNFAENRIVLNMAEMDILEAVFPGTRENFWDTDLGSFTSREWAGATFYDKWLFVNVQSPGVTFAITGPWENGAL